MRRKGQTLIVALMAATISTHALAQSTAACFELKTIEAQSLREKTKLLADYPGTAATLLACGAYASNQPKSDQTTAFGICAGFTCFAIGLGACIELAGRAIEIASKDDWIKRRKSETPCS